MNTLMQNPMFWYAVAFGIFIVLVVVFGRKAILGWLDGEISKIRAELDQASRLRSEAEATLAEYQKKYAEAMADAKSIVAHAQEEAGRLKTEAEADLKEALARQEQQATARIRLTETEAVASVRAAAIDLAMDIARKTLADQAKDSSVLTDQAIAELPKLASTKAKAA
jgi:F-type H+-transporting ATPase subunit b